MQNLLPTRFKKTQKTKLSLINGVMNKLYYFLAALLFLLWFLGYIIFSVGAAIHFIFLFAVIILIFTLYRENKKK